MGLMSSLHRRHVIRVTPCISYQKNPGENTVKVVLEISFTLFAQDLKRSDITRTVCRGYHTARACIYID